MRQIFIYSGVFALGATSGYLIATKRLEEKYNQIAQEEIDSVKEVFENRKKNEQKEINKVGKEMDKLIEELNGFMPEDEEDDKENFRHVVSPLVRSSIEPNPYEKIKTRYDLNRSMQTDSDEEQEETGSDEEVPYQKNPYIISDSEFCDDCISYDKISLFYHSDGVLCSEDEEIIDDIDHTIGRIAFNLLVASKEARPAIFVRNDSISADYEVIGINTPYADIEISPDDSMKRRKPNEEQNLL